MILQVFIDTRGGGGTRDVFFFWGGGVWQKIIENHWTRPIDIDWVSYNQVCWWRETSKTCRPSRTGVWRLKSTCPVRKLCWLWLHLTRCCANGTGNKRQNEQDKSYPGVVLQVLTRDHFCALILPDWCFGHICIFSVSHHWRYHEAVCTEIASFWLALRNFHGSWISLLSEFPLLF